MNGNYAGAISNDGTFKYNSTNAQELSGVISGAGSLEKDNSSTLTLSGIEHLHRQHHRRCRHPTDRRGGQTRKRGHRLLFGNITIASGATFQYSSSASNTDARYDGTSVVTAHSSRTAATAYCAYKAPPALPISRSIKARCAVQGNAGALGGAGTTVTIGASGSENAILNYSGSNVTYTGKTAIVVGAGSSGTKTIQNGGGTNNVENTNITLNDNVIIDDSGDVHPWWRDQ